MKSRSPQIDSDDGQLAALAEELAQLRDLFRRRLLEDKAKNRLYDELYVQLALARDGLTEQIVAPLFREFLLVVDRITSLSRNGDLMLQSVADEILEVLERRDVRRVPTAEVFNPAIHEAICTEPRDDQPPGTILKVLRSGYLLGERLLRAERVIVAAPGTGSGTAARESALEPASAEDERQSTP